MPPIVSCRPAGYPPVHVESRSEFKFEARKSADACTITMSVSNKGGTRDIAWQAWKLEEMLGQDLPPGWNDESRTVMIRHAKDQNWISLSDPLQKAIYGGNGNAGASPGEVDAGAASLEVTSDAGTNPGDDTLVVPIGENINFDVVQGNEAVGPRPRILTAENAAGIALEKILALNADFVASDFGRFSFGNGGVKKGDMVIAKWPDGWVVFAMINDASELGNGPDPFETVDKQLPSMAVAIAHAMTVMPLDGSPAMKPLYTLWLNAGNNHQEAAGCDAELYLSLTD